MERVKMIEFMTEEPDIRIPADEKTLMQVFALPTLEAKFLHAMLNEQWIGKDELPIIKYSIRQLAYKLRMRFDARDRRIWIINDGDGRYGITPTGKRAIKEILEQAHSGESP